MKFLMIEFIKMPSEERISEVEVLSEEIIQNVV